MRCSLCTCVTSISNGRLGGLWDKPLHCVWVRNHYTVCLKDRCVSGASSGLLISMLGMSVEARGPETGTSSYCGLIPWIPAHSKSERRGELISLYNRLSCLHILALRLSDSTHSRRAARSPSHLAPSVGTSPPCAPSRPAATWGTSGRRGDTQTVRQPPDPPPLAQARCPSRGLEGAGWKGRSPPPRSRRRHKRGSGSPSPGCWP